MNRLLLVSVLALSVGGCAGLDNREANGALIGGAGGAVVGGVASHSVGGVLIGGAIGAATGALLADLTRPHYSHRHCYYSHAAGHTVCRSW
jgi:hypothetical protein